MSLINVFDAMRGTVPVSAGSAVAGSEFKDDHLRAFDTKTQNFFYAYDPIAFIKEFSICRIRTNPPKRDPFLPNNTCLRIISGFFWDIYIKKPVSNIFQHIFQEWKAVVMDCLQTSPVPEGLPKNLTIEWITESAVKVQIVTSAPPTYIILFDEDEYPRQTNVKYYTMKQMKDMSQPQAFARAENAARDSNLLNIPYYWELSGTDLDRYNRIKFRCVIENNPFTSDDIFAQLHNVQGLPKEQQIERCIKEIYDGRSIMAQTELRLPIKFQASPTQTTTFSTKEYQKFLAEYMLHNNGVLCWHDAGTGKTLTSIMAMLLFLLKSPLNRVVLVCPAALQAQWEIVKKQHIVPPITLTHDFVAQYMKCYALQNRISVFSYEILNSFMKKWIFKTLTDPTNTTKTPLIDHTRVDNLSPPEDELRRFVCEGGGERMVVFDEIHQVASKLLQCESPTQYLSDHFFRGSRKVKSVLQPTGGYWLRSFLVSCIDKAMFLTATPIQNSVTDLHPIMQNICLLARFPRSAIQERYECLFLKELSDYWSNDGTKKNINLNSVVSEKSKSLSIPNFYPIKPQFSKKKDADAYDELAEKYKRGIFATKNFLSKDVLRDHGTINTLLNFMANFRGMIHRVRSVIPGRGQQKRHVQQTDDFPQEIIKDHYLVVDESSEYFKEYKKLIAANAVLQTLKETTTANNNIDVTTLSELYGRQRMSTSHIYQIQTKPDELKIGGNAVKSNKKITFVLRGAFEVNEHDNSINKKNNDKFQQEFAAKLGSAKSSPIYKFEVGDKLKIANRSYVIQGFNTDNTKLFVDKPIVTSSTKKGITCLELEKPATVDVAGSLQIHGSRGIITFTDPNAAFKNFIHTDDNIKLDNGSILIIKTVDDIQPTVVSVTFHHDSGLSRTFQQGFWHLRAYVTNTGVSTSRPNLKKPLQNAVIKDQHFANDIKPEDVIKVIFSPKFEFLRGTYTDTNGLRLNLWEDKKAVIYTHFLENMRLLKHYMRMDGFFKNMPTDHPKPLVLTADDNNLQRRDKIIQAFKRQKKNVILIISEKSGTGIDLTEVTDVVFYDLVWTGSLYTQIVGRGIRFRSHRALADYKKRVVCVHNLLLQAPALSNIKFADEFMYEKIKHKQYISDNIDSLLMSKDFQYHTGGGQYTLCSRESPFGGAKGIGLLLNPPPVITLADFQNADAQMKIHTTATPTPTLPPVSASAVVQVDTHKQQQSMDVDDNHKPVKRPRQQQQQGRQVKRTK